MYLHAAPSGMMNVWPKTTQVMLKKRIPCKQARLLCDWVVLSSLEPFVYTENDTRIWTIRPVYNEQKPLKQK